MRGEKEDQRGGRGLFALGVAQWERCAEPQLQPMEPDYTAALFKGAPREPAAARRSLASQGPAKPRATEMEA